MQYKNYNIQYSDYGVIIRDNMGKFIIEVVNEEEAEEIIDSGYIEKIKNKEEVYKIDYYKLFCKYCKNVVGVHYIDGKITFNYENQLKNIIKSFKKNYSVEIIYSTEYIGGEYQYIVEGVYEV